MDKDRPFSGRPFFCVADGSNAVNHKSCRDKFINMSVQLYKISNKVYKKFKFTIAEINFNEILIR